MPLLLLRDAVVALRLLKLLDILGRQLRPVDGQRQLVELTGELERHLVVPVIHRGAGVGAHVEVLVPLQDEGYGALHLLAGHFLAVHLEHAGAAPADAADVIKGQSAHAQAVVLEVELQGVFAGRQRLGAFPAEALQVHQVPQEDRLALAAGKSRSRRTGRPG